MNLSFFDAYNSGDLFFCWWFSLGCFPCGQNVLPARGSVQPHGGSEWWYFASDVGRDLKSIIGKMVGAPWDRTLNSQPRIHLMSRGYVLGKSPFKGLQQKDIKQHWAFIPRGENHHFCLWILRRRMGFKGNGGRWAGLASGEVIRWASALFLRSFFWIQKVGKKGFNGNHLGPRRPKKSCQFFCTSLFFKREHVIDNRF